jgi:glycosyltransferase involved in cell wall biosynthesis
MEDEQRLREQPLREPILREQRLRVTHVISGLELGGAETMLCKLLSATDRRRFEPSVISLSTLGPLAPRIAALGVPVSALNMRRGRVQPRPLGRLARGLATRRPHVVHTWMYHADLLGGALARATGEAKVIWGVRGSLDPKLSKRSSRLTARACAAGARWLPDRVVSCSERLAETHIALGYDRERMLVIPNGFDLSWFRPDTQLRAQGRRWVGAGEDEQLVGILGRYDPQKDHRTFIRAAGEVIRERPGVHFVMCGPGVDAGNHELVTLLAPAGPREPAPAGLAERVRLMGVAEDPRAVLNALDVLVSSSAYGEGFPNILGEAMACGVPCVTTDVGDSARIVAETGRVVAVGDWRALAREILALLEMTTAEREALGRAARARVQRNYSLPDIAQRFQDLYLELAGV